MHDLSYSCWNFAECQNISINVRRCLLLCIQVPSAYVRTCAVCELLRCCNLLHKIGMTPFPLAGALHWFARAASLPAACLRPI